MQAFASVTVPDSLSQIKNSNDILIGAFSLDSNNKIYFTVESALKGNLRKHIKVLVDNTSKLAWKFMLGGGFSKPSNEEFIKVIQQKEWFNMKVIVLGSFNNGIWESNCFDWSIWPFNESEIKKLSIEDTIKYIENKLVACSLKSENKN